MRQSPLEFADLLKVTKRTVTYWESGHTSSIQAANRRELDNMLENASPQVQERFRRAVRASEASIELGSNASTLPLAGEEVEDVLRREFLTNVSLAGVGAALGLELTRHSLNQAMAAGPCTDIDDWYEVVRDYGDGFTTETPSDLHEQLLADILSLQAALGRTSSADRKRELYKVGALLSQWMAQTIGDLGKHREAKRWWRTARYAADSSGDLHIMLYIRGRNAIRSIYDGRSPALIIEAIDGTEELMAHAPTVGLPSLLAARAQSYAMLGRAQEAEAGLQRLRAVFSQLPGQMTGDHSWHPWAYPMERVRFTESFVYSYLGQTNAAGAAQDSALRLFPVTSLRGPVQIELQRALCQVRTGDSGQGAQHATATIEGLPAEHRTRYVTSLGEQVMAAIPPGDRRGAAAQELADLIKSDMMRSQKALPA
jgi:hypothetical protein